MTRLLFIGDIVGRPGRELVRRGLSALIAHHQIDLVVANVENAAAGFGVTPDIADDLFVVWRPRDDRRQSHVGQEGDPSLLRGSAATAAAGESACRRAGPWRVVARADNGVPVAVVNVMGRVFMTAIDDPFRVAQEQIERLRGEARVILVDMHAEATSEKVALGWLLDGRATVVVGTHTHVQTADERVLPGAPRTSPTSA